jgi:hypothetical protein
MKSTASPGTPVTLKHDVQGPSKRFGMSQDRLGISCVRVSRVFPDGPGCRGIPRIVRKLVLAEFLLMLAEHEIVPIQLRLPKMVFIL